VIVDSDYILFIGIKYARIAIASIGTSCGRGGGGVCVRAREREREGGRESESTIRGATSDVAIRRFNAHIRILVNLTQPLQVQLAHLERDAGEVCERKRKEKKRNTDAENPPLQVQLAHLDLACTPRDGRRRGAEIEAQQGEKED